ncbi:hypothetical protein BJV74DRAFT_847148 [Russula compacta]|nr:hypothetical protein BJV74DRAFT_847148 [Russula compacta]
MTNQSSLTKELLEGMKRSDLQRVCKERGLKANLKTEAMIELLLDSPPSQSVHRPSRYRAVSTRSVGRRSSTRSRLYSTSSMIVHSDTDEDQDHHAVKPESEAASGLHPGPMTRTRKARDAQLRLGVGRPTVAAGRGPRGVTRSVSISRGTRSRSGRGAKPVPAPTVEGTLEEAPPPPSNHGTPQPRTIENGRIRRVSTMDITTDQAGVRAIVEEQVRPLQRTVASLQRQLQQQTSAHAQEVAALNDRVMTIMNELRELHRHAESIQLLRSSVEQIQTELSRVRHGRSSESLHDPTNSSASASILPGSPSHPTNVRAHRQIEPTRHSRAPQSNPAFEYPPPPAGSPAKPPSRDVPIQISILGKQQRSADDCDTTAILETDQEDTADIDPRASIHRQRRKRAKMEQPVDDASETPLVGPSNPAGDGQPEGSTSRDGSSSETTVARQLVSSPTAAATGRPSRDRVVGDVIFTDQDFDFFDNPTNLQPAEPQPNPSQTLENQPHPFTFAFPGVAQSPVTSTPVPIGSLLDPSSSPALSTLPYPERPHSPSPVPMPHRAVLTRPSQSEAYHPFGSPPGSRNLPDSSATHGSVIDPSSLLRTPPRPSHDMSSLDSDPIDGRRRSSSNDVGAGLGMTSVPTRVEETPVALVRRTMYGTELEGDTRFGDFGVEGVATGFWTGLRF